MPTVQCGEVTIYYEEAGTGDPLFFICGLGADLQIWRFRVSELNQSYRVICYDNRGAGRSSAPDEPYSVEGMAADVIALLDHLQILAASILGSRFRTLIESNTCCSWAPSPRLTAYYVLPSTTGSIFSARICPASRWCVMCLAGYTARHWQTTMQPTKHPYKT
jgi:hypothetical protein